VLELLHYSTRAVKRVTITMIKVPGSLIIFIFTSLYLLSYSVSLSSEMRIGVVTGANKGIGKAIATNLACSGKFSHVILGCRDVARGQAAAEEISKLSNHACIVSSHQLIIGDERTHVSFRQSVQDAFGKVDVLINNAGMAFKGADPTPFEEQCKPTLDVNFRGTVEFTEEMLPLVRKGDDARIVNVASKSGYLSQLRSKELQRKFSDPSLTKEELLELVDQFEADVKNGNHIARGWGNSNYGLSKLALIAMTKIWAREETGPGPGTGIAVNCCCPGYCDTDMTSHKGPRSPSEGARNAVIPAVMENPPRGEFFADFDISTW
jgi:carbonyl reductase 1